MHSLIVNLLLRKGCSVYKFVPIEFEKCSREIFSPNKNNRFQFCLLICFLSQFCLFLGKNVGLRGQSVGLCTFSHCHWILLIDQEAVEFENNVSWVTKLCL